MQQANVDLLLQVHGAIAVTAIGAFYAYSDNTESFVNSLNGTGQVLTVLRRRISSELGARLEPVFKNPGSVPSPVLGPDGTAVDRGTYVERPVNPIGSESYLEAVRDFVDDNANTIAEYRSLVLARKAWCKWSSILSRFLLGLVAWEIAELVALLFDKSRMLDLAGGPTYVACTITGVLVTAALLSGFGRLHNHHRITLLRLRHGDL